MALLNEKQHGWLRGRIAAWCVRLTAVQASVLVAHHALLHWQNLSRGSMDETDGVLVDNEDVEAGSGTGGDWDFEETVVLDPDTLAAAALSRGAQPPRDGGAAGSVTHSPKPDGTHLPAPQYGQVGASVASLPPNNNDVMEAEEVGVGGGASSGALAGASKVVHGDAVAAAIARVSDPIDRDPQRAGLGAALATIRVRSDGCT